MEQETGLLKSMGDRVTIAEISANRLRHNLYGANLTADTTPKALYFTTGESFDCVAITKHASLQPLKNRPASSGRNAQLIFCT